MSYFQNRIFSEIVELLPDIAWKAMLKRILAAEPETTSLETRLAAAYSPCHIVLFDDCGMNEGLCCSWGLRARDSYYYSGWAESGTVKEIARTPEQFIYAWVKNCCGLDARISEMAELVGISNINSIVEHFGDDDTFSRVPVMQRSRPLTFLRDDQREEDYDGMAPCLKNLTPESVREWTVPETNSRAFHRGTEETLLPAVLNSGFAPPWFLTEDQQTLFYKLLRSGDHQGAWMSLNSSQWTMEDARRAILELAKEVERPLFKEFAKAWVALPFPDDWWY